MKDTIHKAASATLGVSKHSKRYNKRDTWLWSDDVETKVREKKRLYHKFLDDKTLTNWIIYKNANRKAKKPVAVTGVTYYKNLDDKLDTRDGERDLYPLAGNERTQGSPAECSNYCPIRLHSHTMKILERILDNRIREIVEITVNHAGFVENCVSMEKYREKHRSLYIAFLDLEKLFDRVGHGLIWYALRQDLLPEELVCGVQFIYYDPKSKVGSVVSVTKLLRVSVGVLQGSALSPLLFVLVMDTVTRDIQRPTPYIQLYADDVFLASNGKHDLEQLAQKGNDRLMQHGFRLTLNRTELLTTDPHELNVSPLKFTAMSCILSLSMVLSVGRL